jgi:hypothetical protein
MDYITAMNVLAPNATIWQIPKNENEFNYLKWTDSISKPEWSVIQAKIAELKAAEPLRQLRQQRNRLLAETDWRFRSDLTPSQEWIDYCQALRDLPANSTPALDENGQLTGVNWPTPPEN